MKSLAPLRSLAVQTGCAMIETPLLVASRCKTATDTAALIKKFKGDPCRLQNFSAAKAANTSANDGEIGHGVIRKL